MPQGDQLDGISPLGEKPESLTQIVYNALRNAIVDSALAAGTSVSEASIARRMKVSKTPVREALLRLESVGLVEQDGLRGSRIVMPSHATIRCAYETRCVLEGGLAGLAAQRATASECDEIAEAAAKSLECAEASNIDGFRSWDHRFHQEVARTARNPRLYELAENSVALTSVLRERDAPSAGDAILCGGQHIAIAEAIRLRDIEAARVNAERHISDVQQMVLAAFGRRMREEETGAAAERATRMPDPDGARLDASGAAATV